MKHTVKSGDTLSGIAKKYGVTVADIQKANPEKITNINLIRIGWELDIPVKNPEESIKEALNECVEDISCLASFKKLVSLLGW